MADSPVASTFVQAANFSPGGNDNVTRVVIHDEEFPEQVNAARDVAHFFANQPHSNAGSSAHYCCDNAEAVGCVHEADRAWHAPPNAGSIGVEHSGYSHQSAAEWADPYSEAMLHVSARLVADICKRHNIPIVWLSVADLLAGERGITSHNNVSLAWKQSSHTDPGPNFPVAHYIDLVRGVASPQSQEWDEMASKDEIRQVVEELVAKYADFTNRKIDEVKAELDQVKAKVGA